MAHSLDVWLNFQIGLVSTVWSQSIDRLMGFRLIGKLWSGLGIKMLGLVADSERKILPRLTVTKPNVSIPNPG